MPRLKMDPPPDPRYASGFSHRPGARKGVRPLSVLPTQNEAHVCLPAVLK